mmetsp:Transcript_28327/g.39134  ORF Transcript_28327/g.39134 Transcript_28327/m.39134 type:complete len:184 (+) Transcript_28327:237-788(+)
MEEVRALLIIDMSVEQVKSNLYRRSQVIEIIKKLVDSGAFKLCLDCRLWISKPSMTSLTRVYNQVGIADTPGAMIIPELSELNLIHINKYNYSAFTDSDLSQVLVESKTEKVYLCGINTDFCVFASALDAFQRKFEIFVLSDACSTFKGKTGHLVALQRIREHFSESSVLLSTDVLKTLQKHE